MNPYEATNGFYVNLNTQAAKWVERTPVTPDRWRIKSRIAMQPTALWVGPGDVTWVGNYVTEAAKAHQLPIISAYAIPYRDLGQESAGGAGSVQEYMSWSTRLAKAIGNRPCVVILETDTLIHMPSLPEAQRTERCAMLSHAVHAFTRHAPGAWVYLDGGDGRWTAPSNLAFWLARSGVSGARGFAVNVSNYNTTSTCVKHAQGIKAELAKYGIADVGYIIDTSRNGAGPDSLGTWCNPAGRILGANPTVVNDHGADALLWIKLPGESDGDCGTGKGTSSGQFVPQLALNLIAGR
jgi:endoglucanase